MNRFILFNELFLFIDYTILKYFINVLQRSRLNENDMTFKKKKAIISCPNPQFFKIMPLQK